MNQLRVQRMRSNLLGTFMTRTQRFVSSDFLNKIIFHFLAGQFIILTKPMNNYKQGQKRGIKFVAGDTEYNRASVFVDSQNSKFADKVKEGQTLKFVGGNAKYMGNFCSMGVNILNFLEDELWLLFEDLKCLTSTEVAVLDSVDFLKYVSPKRQVYKRKLQEASDKKIDKDGEWA